MFIFLHHVCSFIVHIVFLLLKRFGDSLHVLKLEFLAACDFFASFLEYSLFL